MSQFKELAKDYTPSSEKKILKLNEIRPSVCSQETLQESKSISQYVDRTKRQKLLSFQDPDFSKVDVIDQLAKQKTRQSYIYDNIYETKTQHASTIEQQKEVTFQNTQKF